MLPILALAAHAAPISLPVHGGVLTVDVPPPLAGPAGAALLAHLRGSADAVAAYYGTFPVPAVTVLVRATDDGEVHGSAWPGGPPVLRLSAGTQVTPATYRADWIVVHELTHVAFPLVDRRHHWIEEGIATYVEPWARVAAGRLAPEQVWFELARDLPQGIPANGRGLDEDGSWAATYWGGALFCFLSDLDIRKRTENRYGLRDALQAIARTGGIGAGEVHDLATVLAVGDAAVGVPVLTETWRRLGRRVDSVDLDAIWRDLGVERTADGVVLRDDAPLAAIRRSIAGAP